MSSPHEALDPHATLHGRLSGAYVRPDGQEVHGRAWDEDTKYRYGLYLAGWEAPAGWRQDTRGFPPLRPGHCRDPARRRRLGGRVRPRHLAAGQADRDQPQRQPPPPTQRAAVRPHRPALAAGAGEAVDPAAAVSRPERQHGHRLHAGLTRFSEFLTAVVPTVVRGLGDVDRALLERYLAWLTDLPRSEGSAQTDADAHRQRQGLRPSTGGRDERAGRGQPRPDDQ